MIAKAAGIRDTLALARTLEYTSDKQRTSRLKWSRGLNSMPHLPTRAAPLMNIIAERGRELEILAYHLAIYFPADQHLTSDDIASVMLRTLKDIGLGAHPAVILEQHQQERHNCHAMICRRDYDGNTWSTRNDFARIEKSLRTQEIERGWDITPGRHFTVDQNTAEKLDLPVHTIHNDTRLPLGVFEYRKRMLKKARADGRSELQLEEEPFVIRARFDLHHTLSAEHLAAMRQWNDLLEALKRKGYLLKLVARGLVITDGTEGVAASHVSRYASLPKLEARFGEFTDQVKATRSEDHPTHHGQL